MFSSSRRQWLKRGASAASVSFLPFVSHVRAQSVRPQDAWLFASTAALTGPLAPFGQNMQRGVEAAFAQINAVGGIAGKRLVFQVLDDAYVPARSLENAKQLLATEPVLGLIACLGTPGNLQIAPLVEQSNLAHLAPLTGAASLRRADAKNTFHVRASYTDETRKLVQSIVGMGIKSISMVYHDNAYGKEVLGDAAASLKEAGVQLVSSHAFAMDGKNTAEVVAAVLAAKSSAVLLGTAGGTSTGLVDSLRQASPSLPIAGISPALTVGGIKTLGAKARGIAQTSVVPDPARAKLKLVRDFQAAPGFAARGHDTLNTGELEGYISGRIMAEALQRAGAAPSREKIRNAIAGLRNFDLGGFVVDYSQKPYVASKFVDLGIFNAEGRLI